MGAVTAAPARPRLVTLSSVELADHLGEALDVYVSAMGYPPGTARQRRNLWLEHARRPGWRCVGWMDPAGHLIGISYGYAGGPGQWWFEEVRRGLAARGASRDIHQPDWLHDYFELTELHVRPDAQGSRLGEQMLRALLHGVRHRMVLLSTPEYAPQAPGRAWRLYRRLGFSDVLRDHRFTGDSRPFAVLGRSLPLPE
jgi:ribosomal protein S18 acetylase RimI-like enzyme